MYPIHIFYIIFLKSSRLCDAQICVFLSRNIVPKPFLVCLYFSPNDNPSNLRKNSTCILKTFFFFFQVRSKWFYSLLSVCLFFSYYFFFFFDDFLFL